MKYPIRSLSLAVGLSVAVAGCTSPEPGDQNPPASELQSFDQASAGEQFLPNAPAPVVRHAVRDAALEVEEGEATFYADEFEGRRTASGLPFRQAEMVAAHRAFPFGTRLRVTNERNGNQVEVRVVDRGPFGNARFRPVIDLSKSAAEKLGFLASGRTQVKVEVLDWGP